MITNSEYETITFGEKLGKLLFEDSFIVLKGDLASGKTTLTKGIGKALGIDEVINSPTFTILKMYKGRLPLYHIDAYRLESSDYDLGFDEFDDGVVVVEWPEYYSKYLPNEYLKIELKYIDENKRSIEINAIGEKYIKLKEALNV